MIQNRRQFLKSSALLAAPLILPSRFFGRRAPSRSLNVGIVGCGDRFGAHFSLAKVPGVRVVSVCDIWEYRTKEAKAQVDLKNGGTE